MKDYLVSVTFFVSADTEESARKCVQKAIDLNELRITGISHINITLKNT